jgi:hypothetical protein
VLRLAFRRVSTVPDSPYSHHMNLYFYGLYKGNALWCVVALTSCYITKIDQDIRKCDIWEFALKCMEYIQFQYVMVFSKIKKN